METWLQGMDGFSYCMEMLAAALCFFIFLKKRSGFWLRVGASVLMLFFASLLIYPYFVDITSVYNWIWFVFIFVLIIVTCYFCCDIAWKDAILAASCGALLQHTASSLFIVIFYQGIIPEFSGIRYWVLYVCVYLIGTVLIARRLPDEGHYHVSRANAAIMAVTVLTIVLVLSILVKSTTIDVIGAGTANQEYIKLFRLNQIYALGACVLVLALETILQRELRVQRALSENKNLWNQRQLQYEMSRENIAMITRKCHDMKHQIEALIQTESHSERRKSFIESVQDMIEVYDNDVHTGNEALDTILMEKGLYCKVHHIDWTCVADGKLLEFMDVVELFMHVTDICSIFGNALDNAVESVEKRGKEEYKSIGVRVWKKDLFAVIQVENTFDGKIQQKNNIFQSSKHSGNGIGIESVRHITDKNGGACDFTYKDGIFSAKIMLRI